MTDEIPQWAIERAAELACEVATKPIYNADKVVNLHLGQAFASYIAKHEEPPVDPLLIEARELVARHYDEIDPVYGDKCRNGDRDSGDAVQWALEAIRRGIELGKAGAA